MTSLNKTWTNSLWLLTICLFSCLLAPDLTAQCLTPELAVLNSCVDHPNPNGSDTRVESEVLVLSSGLVPVPVSVIGIDLPFNGFGDPNADIGVDLSGNPLGCGWREPAITLLPGCTNIIPLGPNDTIPAGATVVVFATGTTENIDLADSEFNFGNVCSGDRPVYILQSACERTAGAFANGAPESGNPLRTITIISRCGLRGFTYNTRELDPDDGTYYLVGLNQVGNLDCDLPIIPETCPALDTTFFICDPNGDLPTVSAVELSAIYPASALSVSFHPSAEAAETNVSRITEYTPDGSPGDTIYSRIIYAENLCIVVSRLFIEYQGDRAITMIPSEPIGGCDPLFVGMGEFNLRLWDDEIGGGQPVTYYTDAAGTQEITDPEVFTSPETTIFARAGIFTCEGNLVPIELVLEGGPTVGVMEIPTNCPGNEDGGVVLTAFGESPFSFQWAGDTLPDMATVTGLAPDDYTWTVTSRNGCETTGVATVPDGPPLSLSCQVSGGASGPGVPDGSIVVSLAEGTAHYTVTYLGADAGAMNFPMAMGELTGLRPGEYRIVATDANGCVSDTCTAEVTLLDPIILTCAIRNQANGTTVLGAISIELDGGVPPFNVVLSDGGGGSTTFPNQPAGSRVFDGLAEGTYTITVTDDAGQMTSCFQQIIDENCPLTINDVSILADGCSGVDNSVIRLSISGNDGPIFTSWSGGNGIGTFDNMQEAGPLPEGDYFVSVSDGSGCPPVMAGPILVRNRGMVALESATVTPSNPCSPTGAIEVAVAGGGTPPYTIRLINPTNGAGLDSISNLIAGELITFDSLSGGVFGRSYQVVAIDAVGCSSAPDSYVLINAAPPTFTLPTANQVITAPDCSGEATGSLTVAASGGTEPYTYRWIDYPERTSGRVLPPGETQTDLPAGTYTIEIMDANTCLDTVMITLEDGASPAIVCGAQTNAIGSTSGSIVLGVSGGLPPYQITLDQQVLETNYTVSVAGDTLIDGLSPGPYTARVTDANGCVSAGCTFTIIEEPCRVSAVATIDPVNCDGNGSISVLATNTAGTIRYNWSDAGFPNDSIVFPTMEGDFALSILDSNDCRLDTMFSITGVDDAPAIVAMPDPQYELCEGDSLRLPIAFSGTGPFSLAYRLVPLPAGAPVTDATFTSPGNTAVLRVAVSDLPGNNNLIELIEITDANCERQINITTRIEVDQPDTIRRFDFVCRPEPLMIGGRSFDVSNPSDTFMVDDGSSCGQRYEVDITFLSPEIPDTSVVFICPGTEYIIPETQDTFNANRPEGEVAFARAGQCDSLVYVRLDIPPVFIGSYTANACAGDTIRYGGEIYTVDDPGGVARLPGLSSTGCDSLVAVNVSFRRVGGLRLLGDHEICQGDSIELRFAYDGPGGINAQIRDLLGNTTNLNGITDGSRVVFHPEESTIYTLVDAGIGGCPGTFTGDSRVNVNDLTIATEAVLDPADFCVDTLGRVRVEVAGGQEPYTYSWSNGPTEALNRNLLGGTYVVSVEDADGCLRVDSVSIADREQLRAEVSALPPNCVGGRGTIVVDTIFGGSGFYEMSLDGQFFLPVERAIDFAPEVGTGTVTFQDANDCSLRLRYTVPGALRPQLNLFADTTIIIGDSLLLDPDISIALDTAWWSPPLGLRTPGQETTIARPSSSSTYQLNLLTVDGCRFTERVAITVDERLPVYAPSAFSPNGDNVNDFYQLEYGDRVEELTTFQIFDRWGNLVHEGPNGWDGNLDGRSALIGVYVFYATVRLTDGSERFVKGDFVLMR